MVQESECAVVRANMKTVELEARLEQAEKAYNELTTEVEQLLAQKDGADSKQLHDVLDSVEQDKNSLRTELEQLKSHLAAQEAVASEAAEALLHAQQTLSLKMTEHEAEIESLQGQITAKEERASLLEERIAALTDESQANLERLNQSVHAAEMVQHELAKAESVVNEEGHRLGDAAQRIHSLEAQIQELKNALEMANQVQKDESEARSHAQAEVRELRLQLESSAVQLENVAVTVAELETLKLEHSKLVKRFDPTSNSFDF
jgi:chromosome segregation ATPase